MKNKKYLLQPFNPYMPKQDMVGQTLAPLYDTLSVDEARVVANDNPNSFLHISKPEIDLASSLSPYDEQVYKQAQINLNNFIISKTFTKLTKPSYLVYKISKGNNIQIGLVALCDTNAIRSNYIKQHELTRKAKEDDRVNNIIATNGSTSSVMLTHKKNGSISDLLFTFVNRPADLTTLDIDGYNHEVFVINNQDEVAMINTEYSKLDALYVADGHHRTHAANRVSQELAHLDAARYFMVTIFPAEQLNILGYHRLVKDLNNHSIDELLFLIKKNFSVNKSVKPIIPDAEHEFGIYVGGTWFKLTLLKDSFDGASKTVLDHLDCKIINDLIIDPILGITDIKNDSRVDFIGGSRSPDYIMDCANSFESALVITMAPVTPEQLISVSDQKLLMPPKSTWFYPKLCDGLFFYLFE